MSHIGGSLFNVGYNNGFGELDISTGKLKESNYLLCCKTDDSKIQLASKIYPQAIAVFVFKSLKLIFSANSSATWFMDGYDVTPRIEHLPHRFMTAAEDRQIRNQGRRYRIIDMIFGNIDVEDEEVDPAAPRNLMPHSKAIRNPADFKNVGSEIYYLDHNKHLNCIDLRKVYKALAAWT